MIALLVLCLVFSSVTFAKSVVSKDDDYRLYFAIMSFLSSCITIAGGIVWLDVFS